MTIPEEVLAVLDAKFAAVLPHLDERQRRLYLASEAEALGHGGIAAVARLALPPQYAARLFDAQEAGASDTRLQEIAAEALKEVYFQDGSRRAGSLEEVRFTDIEHLEFEL